ncbi:hypothetical protein E2C01_088680 [Portunus trituberculatus]|uniref:Uncharacterized protein n=1 Tax=Portunus trituberculatus TaxID=210409 RepID=A0A5B7JK22_PORTR|nr:hypothetical protein [Portunus trituberculatus]
MPAPLLLPSLPRSSLPSSVVSRGYTRHTSRAPAGGRQLDKHCFRPVEVPLITTTPPPPVHHHLPDSVPHHQPSRHDRPLPHHHSSRSPLRSTHHSPLFFSSRPSSTRKYTPK